MKIISTSEYSALEGRDVAAFIQGGEAGEIIGVLRRAAAIVAGSDMFEHLQERDTQFLLKLAETVDAVRSGEDHFARVRF